MARVAMQTLSRPSNDTCFAREQWIQFPLCIIMRTEHVKSEAIPSFTSWRYVKNKTNEAGFLYTWLSLYEVLLWQSTSMMDGYYFLKSAMICIYESKMGNVVSNKYVELFWTRNINAIFILSFVVHNTFTICLCYWYPAQRIHSGSSFEVLAHHINTWLAKVVPTAQYSPVWKEKSR